MMNFKKLMSLFLAVLMLCGALTGLSVLSVFAEEAGAETESETTAETTTLDVEDTPETRTEYYHTAQYATPQEKIASMTKMSVKGNYAIYADQRSGEVAVEDLTTGQILFTNPYDIGYSNATTNVKNKLMSQIIIKFKEKSSSTDKTYYSFEYAAAKDQIKLKNIKNGIRVEYTIGREEAKHLVPRSIEKTRFETMILAPMEEYYGITKAEADEIIEKKQYSHPLYSQAFYLKKQMAYFLYKDLDEASTDRLKQDMLTTYPILAKYDIYVLESNITAVELEKIEQVIKSACPNYTYEEMDQDHLMTEYQSEDENPPLFKMALEYTIDETGFNVSLPANGIRFNETLFELLELQILPYLGTGNNAYEGYAFFPDGSGALFAFEDMPNKGESVTAKIYGEDYAYHKLEQKYAQVVRYPVFGLVENTRYYDFTTYNDDGEAVVTTISGVVYDAIQKAIENDTTGTDALYKKYKNAIENGEMTERVEKRGYSAVLTAGDALSSLKYIHEGAEAPYDTISVICTPRPRDEYNLADAISVGDNKTVSVVTKRKYTGRYTLHVTMLADETLAAKAEEEGKINEGDWYEASWLGMAMAYRDYLVKTDVLTEPDSTISTGDIPLYIESFGAMETIEKILSVPVEVMRPLTSAKDVVTMYEELSDMGVSNINFKLTGFANGGMYATVPYKLKWEKAVSEDMSMQELFNTAADSNGDLSVYPDFDFSYVAATGAFDGFSMRKHVVRTIDDRNASKRQYMATQQRWAGYYQLAVSPAYFSHFYEELMERYLAYENVGGISVGSLGTALNSDFDEDEPYNREDAKDFVTNALAFISGQKDSKLEVMVDGGNAYTWKYADHILGAAIDSSRYISASYAVPFLGVVLHGYMNFTGTPLNMEGDLNYAKLKAIENGASVYFTLSYQNTQNLKEDYMLSQYYSVRYDIWFDDVVEIYNELNNELKDVQNMPIIDHEFLSGMRVPDTDELDRDLLEEFKEVLNFQNNQQAFLEQLEDEEVADVLIQVLHLGDTIKDMIKNSLDYYAATSGGSGAATLYQNPSNGFLLALSNYRAAEKDFNEVKALYEAGKADEATLTESTKNFEKSQRKLNLAVSNMAKNIIKIRVAIEQIDELLENALAGVELINNTPDCPAIIKERVAEAYQEALEYREEQMGMSFIYTTANLEIQTFLDIQYQLMLDACQGETNHSGEKLVGLLEEQYKAIEEGKYGLVKDSVTYIFLRSLDANSKLTDAELDEKYSMTDNGYSTEGLVRYIKELLADTAEFDPVLNENDVNKAIETYVKDRYLLTLSQQEYKNFGRDSADGAALIRKFFNFNPNKHDSDVALPNSSILAVVVKKVNPLITAKNAGPVALMENVTDGNYDLSAVYTEEQMTALIDSIEAILLEYEYEVVMGKDGAKDTDPYIEYLTPETRRDDIRAYVEAYYYAKVIAKIAPTSDPSLPVLMTKSNTQESLSTLLADRTPTYGVDLTSKESQLVALVEAYKSDLAYVQGKISTMGDALKVYGDIQADLESDYLALFAKYVIDKQKAPSKLEADAALDAKPGETSNKEKLANEVAALFAAEFPLVQSLDDLPALINKVVELQNKYPSTKEGYDAVNACTLYTYYEYFTYLAKTAVVENVTNHKYYYDANLAQMDAAVLNKIEEKKTVILAALSEIGEDHTIVDYLDVVYNVLGDKADPATAFIEDLVDMIPYSSSGKNSTIKSEITNYYFYQLLNSVQSAALTKNNLPTLPIVEEKKGTDGVEYKFNATLAEAAATALKTYIVGDIEDMVASAKSSVSAGQMANYSVSAFMNESEIAAMMTEIRTFLVDKSGFILDPALSEEEANAAIFELVKYYYYNEVVSKLGCSKPVDFKLHEVYGSSLADSCENLYDLVKYYSLNYTDMDEATFDGYFVSTEVDEKDEEEDEASRYVSDDGRIVSVTYGQKKSTGGYTPYKTFVLNYNNFSVNVVYEGVTYTIPAYGYVTVMHPAQ